MNRKPNFNTCTQGIHISIPFQRQAALGMCDILDKRKKMVNGVLDFRSGAGWSTGSWGIAEHNGGKFFLGHSDVCS